jgi:glycosyltransferase involved in cell wall biosynthesis
MHEPPVPFGHASARWYYVLLKGLVERGYRVLAFSSATKTEEMEAAKDLFPAPQYDLRIYSHPPRSGLSAKLATVREPFSYSFSAQLREDLHRELPGCDLLHAEQIWSGWLIPPEFRSQSVLAVHNLYSLDVPLQAENMSARLRRPLLCNGEQRVLKRAGLVLTHTGRMAAAVQSRAPSAEIRVVPLALDLGLYPFHPAEPPSDDPVVLLAGSMHWFPSYSAAVRLLTRLWPYIKNRVPNAKLHIVGWNARTALGRFAGDPSVTLFQDAPSTQPFFEQSTVLLYAPPYGTGIKIKVMEAFAYGLPVVTNGNGIEGLAAQDGLEAGIAEDDNGIIDRTVALLTEPWRRQRQTEGS